MKKKGYRKQKIAVGRAERRMKKFLQSRPELERIEIEELISKAHEENKKAHN